MQAVFPFVRGGHRVSVGGEDRTHRTDQNLIVVDDQNAASLTDRRAEIRPHVPAAKINAERQGTDSEPPGNHPGVHKGETEGVGPQQDIAADQHITRRPAASVDAQRRHEKDRQQHHQQRGVETKRDDGDIKRVKGE